MKNEIALCIASALCLLIAPSVLQAQVDLNERNPMPRGQVGIGGPPGGPQAGCDDEDEDGDEIALGCGITKASVDLDGSVPTLTLWGAFCDDAAVSIGRETGELEWLTVLSANDGSITADLGTGGPGTYLVMVECPCETCSMNVTIGAVGETGAQGPAGPTGAQGPMGPIGPGGPTGPQGATGPGASQGSSGPLDLYVDVTTGDDANDGLTPATAKKRIQAAVNAIPEIIGGDVTIHILPGIYEEQTWITPRARTEIARIWLVGEGTTGSPVIMDGTNVPEFPGIGLIVSDLGVVVTNITLQNYDSESAVHVLTGGLEITNCRILSNDGDSYSGIDVDGGRVDIEDCEFVGNNVAVRSGKSSHVRFFDNSGSVFTDNAVGLLAEENSSIKMWGDGPPCSMTESPMLARDHSTIRGYGLCIRDAASSCTISDPSARCVEN